MSKIKLVLRDGWAGWLIFFLVTLTLMVLMSSWYSSTLSDVSHMVYGHSEVHLSVAQLWMCIFNTLTAVSFEISVILYAVLDLDECKIVERDNLC